MPKLISFIRSQFENSTVTRITVLPQKIDGWHLIRTLGEKKYPFRVGLYQGGEAQVVIKAWRGSKDSIHYQSLLREIRISKVLTKAQKKLKNNSAAVPPFVKAIKRPDGLFFITEYIKGQTLHTRPIKEQAEGYRLARNYLRRISKVLTTKEIKTIGIHRSAYFALTSLVLFPLAIWKNKTHRMLFFQALSQYARIFSRSFKDRLRLVHGDLHPENLIKSGKQIYILDMEQAMVTFSSYEDATTISTKKTPYNIEKSIISKMSGKKNAFQLMIIHVNIHNLVGILAKKHGDFYRDRIKKALTL